MPPFPLCTLPPISAWLLLPAILFAGYFGPGYLLARRWRSPAPLLSAFLGSAVVLFYSVLLLDTLHIRITYASMTGLLVLVCCAIFYTNRHFQAPPPSKDRPCWKPRLIDLWWLIPVICALASIITRAAVEPLSGYDNGFRWNYIAQQLLRLGNLQFYPPFTAEDFDVYGWCDGIPPLAPILNFWIYLGTGSDNTLLTVARIAVEAGLLFHTVFLLGRKLWGGAGGKAAIAVMAASSLLLWGVAMGQETGLTALGMVAMLYFISEYQDDTQTGSLLWAGVAAGVAGLSREYALAFPVIGLFALSWHRAPRRATILFTLVAGAVAAPWYLRNFAHTGNPLYSQDIAGLFPVNEAYAETNRTISRYLSPLKYEGYWRSLFSYIGILAGVPVLLGLVGVWRAGRRGLPLAAAFVLVVGLWFWSLGQTAGGPIYAMRVLTPAVAVAAVLAGWVSRISGCAWQIAGSVVLSLTSLDAARRSWIMPAFPSAPLLPYTWQLWRDTQLGLYLIRSDRIWDVLAFNMPREGVVVDHPGYYAELVRRGGHAVPFFSPRVSPFYDTKLDWNQALAALKKNGIRLVVLTKGSPMSEDFLGKFPFLDQLRRHKPNAVVQSLAIYDLAFLNLEPASTP